MFFEFSSIACSSENDDLRVGDELMEGLAADQALLVPRKVVAPGCVAVSDPDHGEEAICTAHPLYETGLSLLSWQLIICPNHPRIERVVACPVGHVRDAWQQLTIDVDCGCLGTEWIQTLRLVSFLDPCGRCQETSLSWPKNRRPILVAKVRPSRAPAASKTRCWILLE